MSVQHAVLFKFPSRPDAATDAEIRRHVARWITELDCFEDIRFGADFDNPRNHGFHYLLVEKFVDRDTQKAYAESAIHQEFLAWINSLGVETLAMDYPL